MTRLVAAALVLLATGCRPHSPLPIESGPRFTALDDGTVRDNRFEVVWAQSANLPAIASSFEGLTWPEALQFVADMNGGSRPNLGHRDWRLPYVEDLVALTAAFWVPASTLACITEGYDRTCRFQVPYAPFTNVIETCYWSGTTATAHTWQDGRGPYVSSAAVSVSAGGEPDVWVIDSRAHPFPLSGTARCGLWPVRGNFRVVMERGDPTSVQTGKARPQSTIPIVYPGPFPH